MSVKRRRTSVSAADESAVAGWEVVWTGDTEPDAAIIAGSLCSDGIPAVVRGSNLSRHARTVATLPGGWGVLVPASDATTARALLQDRGEPGVSHEVDGLPLGMHFDALRLLAAAGLVLLAIFLLSRILDRL